MSTVMITLKSGWQIVCQDDEIELCDQHLHVRNLALPLTSVLMWTGDEYEIWTGELA